jgi:magnesium transporter
MTKEGQSIKTDFSQKDATYFWIDLFQPTKEEMQSVETYCDLKLPITHMQTGNTIDRFLHDGHTCFMTLLTNEGKNVVMVLQENTLITINNLHAKFLDPGKKHVTTVSEAFIFVIETFIQKISEALGAVAQHVLSLSGIIRQYIKNETIRRTKQTIEQKITAVELADARELVANNRNSLINLRLLINFSKKCTSEMPETIGQSVDVLIDHTEFLNNRISYLHDAVFNYLGITLYNLQSSFSIFSALFFLPTLIMGFFSMNFPYIPFLDAKNSIYFFIFIAIAATYFVYRYLKNLQFA